MNEISNWSEEKRAAYLYRVVAACEAGTLREKLFLGLAQEAEGQALIWEKKRWPCMLRCWHSRRTCVRVWLPGWCGATARAACAPCSPQ